MCGLLRALLPRPLSTMLPRSWFCKLFGWPEATFEQTRTRFVYNAQNGELSCDTNEGCKRFQAGVFTRPSLLELRRSVDLHAARLACPGPLRVQQIVSDVSVLHADPNNRFATFQAASQFNCLEFPHQNVVPEHGITGYCTDRTQGPACAIACAPGTVVRNYFGMEDGSPQRAECQVENLAAIEKLLNNSKERYFNVIGGYTLASDDGLRRLAARLEDDTLAEQLVEALQVGVQWDTQVTNTKFGSVQLDDDQQLVTQVYASACSVSYSGNSRDELWGPFASLVLRAAYEASILVAIQNMLGHPQEPGSRRVFLTALGGGVFGNDIEWIVNAIKGAVDTFSDIGLEVYLVSYGVKSADLNSLER